MKTRILFVLLILISCKSFSQEMSEERKQYWIGWLDSTYIMTAIDTIMEYKIYEALPKLESTIWSKNEFDQGLYIEAIDSLDSHNSVTLAHQILDSLKTNPQRYYQENRSFIDSLFLKEQITMVLFRRGDYSTANFAFELLKDGKTAGPSVIYFLYDIIKNVPELSSIAYDSLMAIINNNATYWSSDMRG